MKAITIMQPFASLIASGEKRVENRCWRTHFRGAIAIHASSLQRSKTFCKSIGRDTEDLAELPASAIVAVADVVDCLTLEQAQQRRFAGDPLEWLPAHEHAHGPWCWVLDNIRKLPAPIAAKGSQGLWNVPVHIEQEIALQVG